MNIRPATTLADAEQLLCLIGRLAEFEHLTPPDEEARGRFISDGFVQTPRRFEALLAGEPDQLAFGYAIFFETYSSFLARPTLYLEDLFILPEQRTKGVGTLIMKRLAQLALERGCGRMEWTCLDWNINAQSFYKRIGAEHMSEWLFYRMDIAAIEKFTRAGS